MLDKVSWLGPLLTMEICLFPNLTKLCYANILRTLQKTSLTNKITRT